MDLGDIKIGERVLVARERIFADGEIIGSERHTFTGTLLDFASLMSLEDEGPDPERVTMVSIGLAANGRSRILYVQDDTFIHTIERS